MEEAVLTMPAHLTFQPACTFLSYNPGTDKACKNFVVAITDELKCNKYTCFIGVMADGATDVETREEEDASVRFL